jgi:hypothetical protein
MFNSMYPRDNEMIVRSSYFVHSALNLNFANTFSVADSKLSSTLTPVRSVLCSAGLVNRTECRISALRTLVQMDY